MWRVLKLEDKKRTRVGVTKLRNVASSNILTFTEWDTKGPIARDSLGSYCWNNTFLAGKLMVDESTLSPESSEEPTVGQIYRRNLDGKYALIDKVENERVVYRRGPSPEKCNITDSQLARTFLEYYTLVQSEEPTWHQYSEELKPLLVKGRKVQTGFDTILVLASQQDVKLQDKWHWWNVEPNDSGITGHAPNPHSSILATASEIAACRAEQQTKLKTLIKEHTTWHTPDDSIIKVDQLPSSFDELLNRPSQRAKHGTDLKRFLAGPIGTKR